MRKFDLSDLHIRCMEYNSEIITQCECYYYDRIGSDGDVCICVIPVPKSPYVFVEFYYNAQLRDIRYFSFFSRSKKRLSKKINKWLKNKPEMCSGF